MIGNVSCGETPTAQLDKQTPEDIYTLNNP